MKLYRIDVACKLGSARIVISVWSIVQLILYKSNKHFDFCFFFCLKYILHIAAQEGVNKIQLINSNDFLYLFWAKLLHVHCTIKSKDNTVLFLIKSLPFSQLLTHSLRHFLALHAAATPLRRPNTS